MHTQFGELNLGAQFDLVEDFTKLRIHHLLAMVADDAGKLIELAGRDASGQQPEPYRVEPLQDRLAARARLATLSQRIGQLLGRQQGIDKPGRRVSPWRDTRERGECARSDRERVGVDPQSLQALPVRSD